MKDIRYKKEYDIFVINFLFLLEPNQLNNFGFYDSIRKEVVVNCYNILKFNKSEKLTKEEEIIANRRALEETVVHELTHFFDYNFWKSWNEREGVIHEELPIFVETFFIFIEGFLNLIRPEIEKLLEEKR